MYLLIETKPDQTSLYLYRQDKRLAESTWSTDRQLSDQILSKLNQLLHDNSYGFSDLSGVGVFAGPGQFTALRLVHVLANTLAYALAIPAVNATNPDWLKSCLSQLKSASKSSTGLSVVSPSYGQPPQITTPRK